MGKAELLIALAVIPDGDPKLKRVAAILSDNNAPERSSSLRLLRICDAVRESGISRSGIYRMIASGDLKTVQIRKGASTRIPEDELLRLVASRA